MLYNNQKALEYLNKAVELYECSGISLDETVEEGNLWFLKLKDTIATVHEMQGDEDRSKALREELGPYEEYITWRVTGNIHELA